MAKNAKFILDLKVWSDEDETSNDPIQNDFRWLEQLAGLQFSGVSSMTIQIATASNVIPFVTANPGKFVFIKTNQPIAVKYNSDTSVLNVVNPTTPGTTQDGILFQKIDLTSLQIDNLGTDTATVLVFVGG